MPSNDTVLDEPSRKSQPLNHNQNDSSITSLTKTPDQSSSIRNLISFYETTYGTTQKETNKLQRQHSTPPVPIVNSQSSCSLTRHTSLYGYRRPSYASPSVFDYSRRIDDDDDDYDDADFNDMKHLKTSSLLNKPKKVENSAGSCNKNSGSARLLFYSHSFCQSPETRVDKLNEKKANSKNSSFSSQSSASSSPLSITPPPSPATHNYKDYSQNRNNFEDKEYLNKGIYFSKISFLILHLTINTCL